MNDYARIRNGSPGSHNATRSAERYKTLDGTSKSGNVLSAVKNFDEEMEEKGIIGEIKDLSRFNYVLVTRSSPSNLEQESFMRELVDRMSSDKKTSQNQKSRI